MNPNELYVNKGEAAFAASNTNIASYKNNIWLATGGKTSRVFYTKNFGKNWYSYSTPITQGKNTTGIYTMAFYNDKIGIIAGGDYTNKFGNLVNKAITKDGGKTWIASTSNSIPKYVSCVQYIPHEKGKKLIAVSTNGIFYSNDFGLNWIQISKQSFYTIRFVNNKLAWLAGNNKISLLKIAL
ncbi:MAG: WD40/YVTN/BNR-like repeat-containing protein [Lutibacter sp.]